MEDSGSAQHQAVGVVEASDQLAAELVQLFTSSAVASTTTTTNSTHSAEAIAARPITRRPGVEEVRNCILSSAYPCIPPACAPLRSEIWQVLLNVYKRNQHGAAAQEFERMIARLSKLPRDPLLVEECHAVSQLLCGDESSQGDDERAKIQSELEILLVWFLTTKSVEYARGMARVVGVFFSLQLPLPTVYDCFYQFCASFLPHFVTMAASNKLSSTTNDSDNGTDATTNDTSSTDSEDTSASTRKLRERQQLVEQLLAYHAPQLAHLLNQWCASGWSDLIPHALLLDDTYNGMAPAVFVPLMDQYLLTGDAMFGLFVVVAAVVNVREELLALRSKEDVSSCVRREMATVLTDPARMATVTAIASQLRRRTPTSYKQSLFESSESFCASRRAIEIAFNDTKAPKSTEAVDMSQWQKRESRTLSGKVFWYHTATGRTQWEHPANNFDPAPALFALPVGVHEVASQVMGEKRAGGGSSGGDAASALRFFVVDCRGLRSSEDLKSGRIPAAYTLDPSVFDSPELIERSMAALDAIKSQVHVVLVGDGVGVPPALVTTDELKTSVRDAVRHDADSMNRAALFFQKRGFQFVSCLDGGYSSWHAFMRDDVSCSPQELLSHVADECHYCRYDTILATGQDPLKRKQKAQAKTRRKKSAMPTTTTLLVNGGEGDASIISTNEGAHPNTGRSSATSRRSLLNSSLATLTRSNMNSSLSNMRSKLPTMMPKLGGWRRSSSTSSNAHNDSSSEPDGSSDRGSSSTNGDAEAAATNGQRALEAQDELDEEASVASPVSAKAFVAVFTIDDSDEEDDQEEFSAPPPTGKELSAGDAVAVAVPLAASSEAVAATQSA